MKNTLKHISLACIGILSLGGMLAGCSDHIVQTDGDVIAKKINTTYQHFVPSNAPSDTYTYFVSTANKVFSFIPAKNYTTNYQTLKSQVLNTDKATKLTSYQKKMLAIVNTTPDNVASSKKICPVTKPALMNKTILVKANITQGSTLSQKYINSINDYLKKQGYKMTVTHKERIGGKKADTIVSTVYINNNLIVSVGTCTTFTDFPHFKKQAK